MEKSFVKIFKLLISGLKVISKVAKKYSLHY